MKRSISFILTVALLWSCAGFIDIEPPKTEMVSRSVFTEDAAALAAMQGVYSHLTNSHFLGSGLNNSVSELTGLSAGDYDFLYNVDGFAEGDIDPGDPHVTALWKSGYKSLYHCNAILEAVQVNPFLDDATLAQLVGESSFIRALNYFYLVNLFGDVPLVLTTDYTSNSLARKAGQDAVYGQVLRDLAVAVSTLPMDYGQGKGQRVRANSWVARALRARVYLYLGDWQGAQAEASAVIENTGLFNLAGIDDKFLANNRGAIWQLYPSQSTMNNAREAINTFNNATIIGFMTVAESLVTAFEAGDFRKDRWLSRRNDYVFPTKYQARIRNSPPFSEYSTVIRLEEMHLIRAEARVHLGDMAGALADIELIRHKAGLAPITANSPEEAMARIRHERRVEFFGEYGHRWFDLKRWGMVDKPGYYPIPENEYLLNPNLQ